ncbi:MAG: ABC transporter ATP-binding protein [Thermomicrobiales bacterium]|nr:ABC transporter ATP-binding protein [Thermomicrobiales bacterium]
MATLLNDHAPQLVTDQLTLSYLDDVVVRDLSLTIPSGKMTALIGANGSGKSTILKALGRVLKPRAGAVYLDGETIHGQSTRAVARRLALLPQSPDAPDGLTVRELVGYGRFPYQRGFGALTPEDLRMIDWALTVTGLHDLAARAVGSLSGGQRQRAWIGMALAQGTPILLLDEPTTYLDMAHQLEVLQLLDRLNRDAGHTIVMVLHDLHHAARYAHYLVAIQDGQVIATGAPQEIVTPQLLRNVFGVEADILIDPRSGVPLCVPYALAESPGEHHAEPSGPVAPTARMPQARKA